MESSTKDLDYDAIEGMLNVETEDEQPHTPKAGTLVVLGTIGLFIIAAIVGAMILIGNLQTAEREKHTRMESLAATVSADQNWVETKSEKPSENSKGWLVREWRSTSAADLDAIATKFGVTMSDVAYPSGCQEGSNGEFLIQLCAKPDTRTVSLVVA